MEPIEGVDLATLVSDASLEMLNEQKRDGVGKVKKLFAAIYDLATEIKQLNATLAKKTKQLADKQATLEKIKGGDWTALQASNQNKENETNE